MDPKSLRKRQIARRLGVSEQVLEQYLQLKNAEVLQPASTDGASVSTEESTTATPRQRRSTPRIPTSTLPIGPDRG